MTIHSADIDRASPVPVYYQIAMDMKSRIAQREWELDQRLPTEMELAEQYEVSRITLRQAMAELEKDGIIVKQRGRGTFIHAEPAPFVTKLNYLLTSDDQATRENRLVTAKVLEQKLVTDLFPAVYEHLRLRPEDQALYIKRLFMLNGHPVAIGRSHIPARLVPGLEKKPLINNSLSTTLRKEYQLTPLRVEDYLEAVRATQAESALLKCNHDTPLILIEGTSYLPGGEPLEYSCTLWAGDSVRFHLPLRLDGSSFCAEI